MIITIAISVFSIACLAGALFVAVRKNAALLDENDVLESKLHETRMTVDLERHENRRKIDRTLWAVTSAKARRLTSQSLPEPDATIEVTMRPWVLDALNSPAHQAELAGMLAEHLVRRVAKTATPA